MTPRERRRLLEMQHVAGILDPLATSRSRERQMSSGDPKSLSRPGDEQHLGCHLAPARFRLGAPIEHRVRQLVRRA